MRMSLLASLFVVLATPAMTEVPRVAVDIPPVHGLVARVMQGLGTPDTIVQGAASAHSYDLRPSAARALGRADIVVRIGDELTPWLAHPIETLAADATVLTLLQVEGTHLLSFRHDEDFGATEPAEHDHEHDGTDPHAWLDPENAVLWLEAIAETLAASDPDNAEAYIANAAAGAGEIDAAARNVSARLSDKGPIRFAVAHDAYQYFEHSFGLVPIGAITLGDAAAPGPARISHLQEILATAGATCLLVEPQDGGALARMLAETGGIAVVEADPMGTTHAGGPDHYPLLLTALAESFASCP